MFELMMCCICRNDFNDYKLLIYSYKKEQETCSVTKCVCHECKEKTHNKWVNNGWILLNG